MYRVCVCGELVKAPAHRCNACRTPDRRTKPSATQRGYPYWWTKLAKAAVAQQNWCTDCLTIGRAGNPITLDHGPEAWTKINQGKRLTMKDCAKGLLTVRCLRCNIAAGSARGTDPTHA